MPRLEKKIAIVTFANIFYQIFIENGQAYPDSFDKMGSEFAKKLYKEFKSIEGNQVMFDKMKDLSAQPALEIMNEIELIDTDPLESALFPEESEQP